MNLHPHDGPAAEGSSYSALCAADESQRLERLQQMLSTFSHRCRNSLNGIKMSMYLFKREFGDPAPQYCSELERTYQELEVLFDRLQIIYRPLSVTFVQSPLGQLFSERLPTWRSWLRARGKTIDLSPPANEVAGDFDPMYLGIGLDALVKWRAESGSRPARALLGWRITDGHFEVSWHETRLANNPDRRGCESDGSNERDPGERTDSLAYPLLKRIIDAHDGVLDVTHEPDFGVELRWPQLRERRQEVRPPAMNAAR